MLKIAKIDMLARRGKQRAIRSKDYEYIMQKEEDPMAGLHIRTFLASRGSFDDEGYKVAGILVEDQNGNWYAPAWVWYWTYEHGHYYKATTRQIPAPQRMIHVIFADAVNERKEYTFLIPTQLNPSPRPTPTPLSIVHDETGMIVSATLYTTHVHLVDVEGREVDCEIFLS